MQHDDPAFSIPPRGRLRTRKESDEVLFVDEAFAAVTAADIDDLTTAAALNTRQRIRLCAHRDTSDKLHDMFIVHRRETYVRPHKHLGKAESFHVVQGSGRIVIFDDIGRRRHTLALGDFPSGLPFYYRLAEPLFHTLLIDSDVMVFHESATGPFDRADTVLADWSPSEEDTDNVRVFLERLRNEQWEG